MELNYERTHIRRVRRIVPLKLSSSIILLEPAAEPLINTLQFLKQSLNTT